MRRIIVLPRLIIFTILCAVLFPPTLPVRAQEPKTVTGTGAITLNAAVSIPLTITFAPAGGPVTGRAYLQKVSSNGGYECTNTADLTWSGIFDGGDGGAASGPWTGTESSEGPGCMYIHTTEADSTWSGNFNANGTGEGTFIDSDGSAYSWQVTYSAAEFQAALKPPVTKDYILSTYGLKLEGYYDTDWSQHELELLNDVLKDIPADLLKKMALTSIIRSAVYIDENMKLKPGRFGDYSPCGDLFGNVDCSGSSAQIRIYDKATSPYDFADDPDGDTEFKATILHEMIHAMQYQKDSSSTYDNPNNSPLVQDYMDATRPKPGTDFIYNGWAYCPKKGEWELYGAPGNEPPTNYGKTDPMEDMSESAMMYVYDPQKLQTSSPQRYAFIKDKMFGGVEYENGIQKKP
jgi:hypothetical protein